MSDPKVVGRVATESRTTSSQNTKGKPNYALPTDRVGFLKQWELLRAYSALTLQGKKIVTNPEVSALVRIHPNTAILAHPFFIENGLLQKEGTGYVASPEVLAYAKAFNWNAETAPQKLAPLFRTSWFANTLLPRLAMGTLTERQAVEALAAASGAHPRFEGQLKTILAYLAAVGLVRRDGDTLSQAMPMPEDSSARTEPTPLPDSEPRPNSNRETGRGGMLSTAFSQAPEGVLRFNVDVSVDMKEFAMWKPERISAFWSGIAQVLAAKAAVEGEASK